MPVHDVLFNKHLGTARRHLKVLERRARKVADPAFNGALQGLSAALEGCRVEAEAMRRQDAELLAARETLEAERRRYWELYELAPDGYLVTDLPGVIQEANRAAAELLGTRQTSLIGKPLSAFVEKSERADFLAQSALWQGRPAPATLELTLKPRARAPFAAALSARPAYDGHERLIGWRWTFRDISVHRQAMAALQALNTQLDQRVRERTSQLENETAERRNTEAALQKSEERHRSLVAATSQIVWTTNAQGEVVDDLPTWQAFTGQSKAKMAGWGWFSAVHPDDRQRAISAWSAAVGKRRLYEAEYRLRNRQGDYRHFAVRGVPVVDKDGAVREWVGICFDITDRKSAEEALQLTSKYNRSLIEASLDPLITIAPDGRIEDVNAATEEITGHPRVALIGTRFSSYFTDVQKAEASYRRVFEEGQVRDYELEIRHRRGGTRPVLYNATVYRDEVGRIRGVVAAARDITARKHAEDLLRRNEQRSQTLAEVSQTLAEATQDYHMVLTTIARRTAELFGDVCLIRLLSDDGQWLAPAVIHHPDPALAHRLQGRLATVPSRGEDALASRVAQTGLPIFIPVLNANEQAEVLSQVQGLAAETGRSVHSLVVVLMRAQGRLIGTLALARLAPDHPYTLYDQATAQSLADRAALAIANARLYRDLEKALAQEQAARAQLVQSEKLAAMGRMVGSVAHELHNPLQTIQNCLFLTRNAISSDSPVHHYLEMADSEILRLSNLVEQLWQVYRPRPTGQMQRLDPWAILEQVMTLVQPQLQKQHIQWHLFPRRQNVLVNGLEDQLKQVFINLSLNAADAMQPGGGTLSVRSVLDSKVNQVGIIFSDTGSGILEANMAKLFEPFFTTKPAGLGLGLSICNDIVLHHGGKIVVESVPGHGATFTVWLPVAA